MSKNIFIILTIAGCVISCWPDCGFVNGMPEEGEWNPVSAGPITTWTAPLCGQRKLVVQPFFFYNRTRGVFNEENHYKSFTNKEMMSQYQEQLFLQYGITDRLEIDAQGVYQQNLHHVDGDRASSTGFGDSYIFARCCAIEENGWVPHVTALFQLKLPTGKYQKASEGRLGTDLMGATSGGGSYDTGYGVMFTKKLKPFILHADFIYSIPMITRVDGVKTQYSDYVNYDFGIEYFFPMGFSVVVELNGFMQGDMSSDGELVPSSDMRYLNMAPGVGWACDKIQMLLAYQRTLAGTNTDVNDSLIFTFVYTF